jgi:hypothetical protein
MRIDSTGRVGINTQVPNYALDVNGTISSGTGGFRFPDGTVQATSATSGGNASASAANVLPGQFQAGTYSFPGTVTASSFLSVGQTAGDSTTRLTVNGALQVNGVLRATQVIGAVYQDVAEWVPSGQQLAPGTVVIINSLKKNEVMPSSRAYDTSVAGVVSDQPGILLGVPSDDKSKIATTGRVRVRVDATKHPINAGDLLVTSDKPGVAMLSEPLDLGGVKIHRPGTLIGKALEPLSQGEGEILVLLSLQ